MALPGTADETLDLALVRVLPRSAVLTKLATRLLDRAEKTIEFDRAAFCRISAPEEIEIFMTRPVASQPPAGTRMRFTDVLGTEALRLGLAIAVDLSTRTEPFDAALYQIGYRYVLRVPIGTQDHAAAALALLRRSATPFSQRDITRAAKLATAVGPAIMSLTVPQSADH